MRARQPADPGSQAPSPRAVAVRFLLGPAGSGKTSRCLREIREELIARPEGAPLVLLAPKQATYQLERQLLEAPALSGYARLQIVSFERLAAYVLSELSPAPPSLLAEEGRLMVLRALLARHQDSLRVFRASARLPGFAGQLSLLLRELHRHQFSPDRLQEVARRLGKNPALSAKLADLASLMEAYGGWLHGHHLQDGDRLLDLAATVLNADSRRPGALAESGFAGLWLDGFAEMTPQELDFLAAVIRRCRQATLAFCLEAAPAEDPDWVSLWSITGRTFRRCWQRLAALPGCQTRTEVLTRGRQTDRFAGNPVLAHLECHWAQPVAFEVAAAPPGSSPSIRLIACTGVADEAKFAAREILRFVRAGGRYRETAVLLRSLEGFEDAFRRVFGRYEIPFFLDRREPIAHHPLAELTRSAVRMAAFGWQHEDWFGALKTGFARAAEVEIDALENEALARGWRGTTWRQRLVIAEDPETAERLDLLRRGLVEPFVRFEGSLGPKPTGPILADALRMLWEDLDVRRRLAGWSQETQGANGTAAGLTPVTPHLISPCPPGLHATAWAQLEEWIENLALAFQTEALSLAEWLPILETGLANLTVGVIPPAIDQVVVGTIDRSRNPELRLVILPGWNESIFPAPPAPPALLTEADRDEMEEHDARLGPNNRLRLGQERYYGYIACTRACERVVCTFSARNTEGRPLNPSPFITHLQRLFPSLEPEHFSSPRSLEESEHCCEVLPELSRLEPAAAISSTSPLAPLFDLPDVGEPLRELNRLRQPGLAEGLSPAVGDLLYGRSLRTSVSRLEEFAACPFRFFVSVGLRAEERRLFELDARQQGDFRHAVLAEFHREIERSGRRWRDVPAAEARQLVRRVADRLAPQFGDGLLLADDRTRFTVRAVARALQDFVGTVIDWMDSYGLDPVAVELGFGRTGDALPAWEIDLGDGRGLALRGIIDRVDLVSLPGGGMPLCVVVDYKSRARSIDPVLLEHGIQLQLPAYLAALRRLPSLRSALDVDAIKSGGVFYADLHGRYKRSDTRQEALKDPTAARRQAYGHRGRFSQEALPHLDRRQDSTSSGQFSYALTKDGKPNRKFPDLMEAGEFEDLLDRVERLLREAGQAIFRGVARVDPYKKGTSELACTQCRFQAVCRIDPWAHAYRVLS